MAVMPVISLGGGLVPPIGALIGTMGSRHVVGAITNTGTPLDWSMYDQSKLDAVKEFNRTVIQPVATSLQIIQNANISSMRNELEVLPVTVESLRNPTIMMRDVIMSIPEVNSLAADGRIWGYGLSSQVVESYAQGCRPYELMTTDLGTRILPHGHECYGIVDDTEDDNAYVINTTILSGNDEHDNYFNGLTISQLADIDDAIYKVRVMLDTTLTDPTAPDSDRG